MSLQIIGSVDRCDEKVIEGWVTVVGEPMRKLRLEVMLGDRPIGACVADAFRPDLEAAGIAEGRCAFAFPMPSFVPRSEVTSVRLRIENSIAFLDYAAPRAGDGVECRPTVSRFGGLWIDRHDWLDRLALKCRNGEVSDELSIRIFRFVRDGYLIIPGAVPASLVDSLNQEIERVWDRPPDGLLIETFEPTGEMRYVMPEKSLRAGRTKMLDLYAYSAVAREVIAAPPVMEFLAAIFEDKPKAFQGLTFWNGSQQAIHKDTAYVKVDSNPMHLAATWLALEDIAPGTGELEYYIGSHRAPDFLFGGISKWMESNHAEHGRFLDSLHADAEAYRHVRGSFLAQKGDVLVWHADLAHGGAPIQKSNHTRRSLVTHFTADSDEPFYRRSRERRPLHASSCNFVSQYADVH